jgi:hypothetical protein
MTRILRNVLALSFFGLFGGAALAVPADPVQPAAVAVAIAAEAVPCVVEDASAPLMRTVVDRGGDQNRTGCVKACLHDLDECRVACGGFDQGCWTACQLIFNQCKALCDP